MLHSKSSAALENGHAAGGPHAGTGSVSHVRARPDSVVLIASPQPRLRKLWREGIHGFAVAEVAHHGELVRRIGDRVAAVVLLDLELPDLGGMDGVAALQRLRPTAKVVVLTPRPDDSEGVIALKIGARGYCDRNISPVLLGKALTAVQNGEIWIGRKLTSRLLDELTALAASRKDATEVDARARLDSLTRRERAVIHLLSVGATNKDISQKLTITERTVKAHLTAVFRKLGISGRLQAALIAIEHAPGGRPARPFGPPSTEPLTDRARLSGASG